MKAESKVRYLLASRVVYQITTKASSLPDRDGLAGPTQLSRSDVKCRVLPATQTLPRASRGSGGIMQVRETMGESFTE